MQRTYDRRHKRIRAIWATKVAKGGVICARPECGKPICFCLKQHRGWL
jgi:hypothetical protein